MEINTRKLAQNRAEEFGNDVFGDYVIPPFYNELDLNETLKPRIIVGGRGCGKTMLLRYLCFDSVLSSKKTHINAEDLKSIGLYWRINTQVSGLLKEREIAKDVWINAFQHYSILIICLELLRFINVLGNRSFQDKKIVLSKINLKYAQDYLLTKINDIDDLEEKLKSELRKFNLWISNVHEMEQPLFLSKSFLEETISQIKTDEPILKDTNFFIYIDEFENLENFQKPLINTWLKHSSYPLIFNIAMKKGIELGDTLGDEKIVDIHDYRVYDIEDFLSDDSTYKYFASEILLLRLSDKKGTPYEIYKKILVDPKSLNARSDKTYREMIIKHINEIFPSISYKNIAREILETPVLKRKYDEVVQSLDKRTIEAFLGVVDYTPSNCDATLVIPFILRRSKNNNIDVISEYRKHCIGKKSKFLHPTDWIKNNLVAAILYIYDSSQNVCPIFSGFDTFCKLSHGNIRYMLELCYKSLQKMNENESSSMKKTHKLVSQAEAAKHASYSFLNEIRRLGKNGNSLYLFAYRIGLIFKMAGKNPLLSEPEINHFTIKNYKEGSNREIDQFLIEAIKWSVIYKSKSNKLKNSSSTEDFDYILNPIYSPFFNISFRKIRKLEIEKTQFLLLVKGGEDEFSFLLKNYQSRWNLNKSITTLNLFDL